MGLKDLKDILEILGVSASPAVLLGIGWFIYAGYREFKALKQEVLSLKEEIHTNGFVKKDILDEIKKDLDARLDGHDDWIRKLAIRLRED